MLVRVWYPIRCQKLISPIPGVSTLSSDAPRHWVIGRPDICFREGLTLQVANTLNKIQFPSPLQISLFLCTYFIHYAFDYLFVSAPPLPP